MATKNFPLTLSRKMEIIIAVEKNEKLKTLTKTKIAENFQIPKTTLSTIIRNKSKITEAFQQSQFEPGRKRLRTAMYEDLEEVLLNWIGQARSLNVPLGGPIILEKANSFAKKLGYSTFKCSTGWLERFKLRYNITFKKICGESAIVTSEMTMRMDFNNSSKLALEICLLMIYTMQTRQVYSTSASQTRRFY